MDIQITNAGVAALNASTGPIVLNLYKLGDAFGFTPSPTDTDIHGNLVYSGVPSAPIAVNGNLIKYSFLLDYNLGPFGFGNFGLYMTSGTLFAIGASSELINKIVPSANVIGNTIRVDAYLSMVGTNYEMWMDLAETNNEFRMAVFESVDQLPPANNATPNAYVITGASVNQSAFMAYTDRNALWNFDAYKFASSLEGPVSITGFTSNSVTIPLANFNSDMEVSYFGQRILEFTTGALYGICRYVQSTQVTSTTATLVFDSNLAATPVVGDQFLLFSRDPLSSSNIILPVASPTQLGAIKIGGGLSVDGNGVATVVSSTIPGGVVVSVNSKQGVVSLQASDIPGTVRSVNSVPPDTSGNVNVVGYTLPVANKTTLGGVKASSAAGTIVTINSQGVIDLSQTPVLSLNGNTGNVTLTGLINPTTLQTGADLNTLSIPGIYYANNDNLALSLLNAPLNLKTGTLEVIPITNTGVAGACIQRWYQKDLSYFREYDGTTWYPWQGGTTVVSFNGQTGAVTLLGLINPTAIPNAADLNTYKTSGLYFAASNTIASSLLNAIPGVEEGSLEVIPLTTNNGGDLIQRWVQTNAMYYRSYVGTSWGAWLNSAGTLAVATTTTLGGVIVGSGLSVDTLGTLSADPITGVVKTINATAPDGTGNVNVTTSMIGAVATSQVGVQGGVAGYLDSDPNPSPPNLDISHYTYGRLAEQQLPLGAMYYFGTWDASANNIVVNATGPVTISLQNAGLMTYSYPNSASPGTFITYQVPADGQMFRVATAGTTALDGVTSWAIDDVVMAIGNKWYQKTASNGAFDTTVYPNVNPVLFSDFQNTKSLAPSYTYSRASVSTYVDAYGLHTAASSAPVFENSSLRLELAATNYATYSADLSNAIWVLSNGGAGTKPVVTANSGVAPDGTTTAAKIVFANTGTTVADMSVVSQAVASVASTSIVQSIWLKTTDGSTQDLYFDFNGTAATMTGYNTSHITVTGAWQRFAVGLASAADTARGFFLRLEGTLTTSTSVSVYAWGAQVEHGVYYPSSYIATTTASVTRVADSLSITGTNFTNLWNPSQGSITFDFTVPVGSVASAQYLISSYVSATSLFGIYLDPTLGIQSVVNNVANQQLLATWVVGQVYKVCMTYVAGTVYFVINGGLGSATFSTTLSGLTALNFASYNATDFAAIGINNFRYYSTAITVNQAKAITSL